MESVPATEGRIPVLTSVINTVGYLEDYAEGILPANLYQEFLHSKRKANCLVPDKSFFVQAPLVSWREVIPKAAEPPSVGLCRIWY